MTTFGQGAGVQLEWLQTCSGHQRHRPLRAELEAGGFRGKLARRIQADWRSAHRADVHRALILLAMRAKAAAAAREPLTIVALDLDVRATETDAETVAAEHDLPEGPPPVSSSVSSLVEAPGAPNVSPNGGASAA